MTTKLQKENQVKLLEQEEPSALVHLQATQKK